MRSCAFILSLTLLATDSGAFAQSKANIERMPFGKTADGVDVNLYLLTNSTGMKAKIITYGAIVTELWAPDKDGKFADVVLGFDNLKGYLDGHPYFGAMVGRVANRVAKGKFTLDGKEYKLATNYGPNALHGGIKGFDKVVWTATNAKTENKPILNLEYVSKDGEEGYPGELKVNVRYELTDSNELAIAISATTDKATPVNITNHSYFNLAGHQAGDILGHELQVFADKYTPTDDTLIPTGKIEPVKGTPYDFTALTAIGKHIKELTGNPGGYDVNFVLKGEGLKRAARVVEPKSGREMLMSTTAPGVQFYTGNFLDGTNKGKGGAIYQKHAALCLEAQDFPNAINQSNFPSVVLKPGKTYEQTTVYQFSVSRD